MSDHPNICARMLCVCAICDQYGNCPYTWEPEIDLSDNCPGYNDPECTGYIECLSKREVENE